MHKTPWTKGANTPASSLPSDRLRPKNNLPPKQGQQKSKSQQQHPLSPGGTAQKSKAVRELESLISNLESNITPIRDPKGGCFCLAREHPLSPYTPLCTSCGLVLCKLNKPYHTCPHCTTNGGGGSGVLLSPPQRASLLLELRETLDSTLAQEEADRVRQIEEAKKAAGAFPTLSSTTTATATVTTRVVTPTPTPSPTPQQHKVLSLTGTKSKSGRKVVTVSSYTSTPVSSRPATPSSINSGAGEEAEVRVPPPPQTVQYVVANHMHHRSTSRPWQNFGDGGSVRYCAPVPPSPLPEDVVGGPTDSDKTKSRRKGKGKGGGGGGG